MQVSNQSKLSEFGSWLDFLGIPTEYQNVRCAILDHIKRSGAALNFHFDVSLPHDRFGVNATLPRGFHVDEMGKVRFASAVSGIAKIVMTNLKGYTCTYFDANWRGLENTYLIIECRWGRLRKSENR